MNDFVAIAERRLRLIGDEHEFLEQEAFEIQTALRVYQRLCVSAETKSPPETTLPAKTSSAEREGGDSSAPIQEYPRGESGTAREASGGSAPSDGIAGLREGLKAAPRTSSQTNATNGKAAEVAGQHSQPETGMADADGVASRPSRAGGSPAPIQESQPDMQPASNGADRPSGDNGGQPIQETEAPKPLPETLAEAKTSERESLSNDSGEVQDEVRSTSPTLSPETASEEPLEPNTVGCGPQGEQNGTVTGGERPAQIPTGKSGEAAPSASPALAKPARVTLESRIAAYLADHPQALAAEIAAALGKKTASIIAVANDKNLPLRKMTPEERSEAQRRAHRVALDRGTFRTHGKTPAPAAEARAPVPAPTHAPIPERPPAPIPEQRAPAFEAGDPDEDYIHPSLARLPAKPGNKVSLKDQVSGFYLHDSLTVLADKTMMLTMDADRAWRGTRQQLHAVRSKFPMSAKLVLIAVPVRRKA